jgi:hypothetical protein
VSTDNVAVVRRWFDEVWNQRRPETIDELMAADAFCWGGGADQGAEGVPGALL